VENGKKRGMSWVSDLNIKVLSEGTAKVKARTANRFIGNGR